ncbi:uncharacterized protein L199_001544 [Kwoniella botswanensis]|uniref:uncharacterized protein n=1 Tax=Kwoniella botswanensis TaxID=1268659 RepID=UPI00315DFE10
MLSIPEEYEIIDCTQPQKVEPSQRLPLPNRLHRAGSILDDPTFLRFSHYSPPIKSPSFSQIPKPVPPFPLGAAHAALVEGIDEGIWRAVKKARKEERREEKRIIKRQKREEGQREVLSRISSGLEVVCIYDDEDEEGDEEGELYTLEEASYQTGTIDDEQLASPMTPSIKESFPPPSATPLSTAPRPFQSHTQNTFDDLPATQPDILEPLEDISIPIDTDQLSSEVSRLPSGQDIHTSSEVTNIITAVEAGYSTSDVMLSDPAEIEMTIAEEGSQVLDVQTSCSSDIIHSSSSAISPEMGSIQERQTQGSFDMAGVNTVNDIVRGGNSISQSATSTDASHVEPSGTSLTSQLSDLITASEVSQNLPPISNQDEPEKRDTGSSSSFYTPSPTPAAIRASTDPNGQLTHPNRSPTTTILETPVRPSDEEDICPSSQFEDHYWDSPLANLGRGVPKPSRNHVTKPIPYYIFQAPISPSYKTGATSHANGESTKAKFDMRKTGYLPTPSPSPSPTKLPKPNFRGHVIPGHSALGVGKFF